LKRRCSNVFVEKFATVFRNHFARKFKEKVSRVHCRRLQLFRGHAVTTRFGASVLHIIALAHFERELYPCTWGSIVGQCGAFHLQRSRLARRRPWRNRRPGLSMAAMVRAWGLNARRDNMSGRRIGDRRLRTQLSKLRFLEPALSPGRTFAFKPRAFGAPLARLRGVDGSVRPGESAVRAVMARCVRAKMLERLC
jgi:hypothetical protein